MNDPAQTNTPIDDQKVVDLTSASQDGLSVKTIGQIPTPQDTEPVMHSQNVQSVPPVVNPVVTPTPFSTTPAPDNSIRSTGIHDFDTILAGGFPVGATVLLAGESGTGKTILAMQWLFAGYEQYKEPGLYISLTEPVVKAVKNVAKMSFFKKENLGPLQIYFTDLRGIMKGMNLDDKEFTREDVETLVGAIENMVMTSKAKRIVIDSVTAMAYRLKDKDLIRNFIFKLGTVLAQTDANVVLTSEVLGEGFSIFGVEEFISDGIIKLTNIKEKRGESVRKLEVVKMRGSTYDSYQASFRITKSGLVIFPYLHRELTYKVSDVRVSTGIPGLNEMTSGGYFEGSSVLLTGASGTGKTIASIQFLVEGLSRGEKAIYVSFEESRDQLIRNAKSFGWDLVKYEKDGLLKIMASYPEQLYLEEHIDHITEQVKLFKSKRIIIDSLSSLGNIYSDDILRNFTSRLIAFTKDEGVTTLLTVASSSLMGTGTISDAGLSTLTDHIIMLRYIEIESELKHGILILKMRGSPHDKKLREITFAPDGIRVLTAFVGYEGILGGSAKKVGSTVEDQLKVLYLEVLGPMGEKIFNQEHAKGISMKNIKALVEDLGSQGILSENKKVEFISKAENILEKPDELPQKDIDEKTDKIPQPMTMEAFLNLSGNKT